MHSLFMFATIQMSCVQISSPAHFDSMAIIVGVLHYSSKGCCECFKSFQCASHSRLAQTMLKKIVLQQS